MATHGTQRWLLTLLLVLVAALQGRAQLLPGGYADDFPVGGDEDFRAAQGGPSAFGPPLWMPPPYGSSFLQPARQIDPLGPQPGQPLPPPGQPLPPAPPPASPPAGDGPQPLQPNQFPRGTPFVHGAQLAPFPQWPLGTQFAPWSHWSPGGQFPAGPHFLPGSQFVPPVPQLPLGWPSTGAGNPLSAIPILSPVPTGFVPLGSGPLPLSLPPQQQQQPPSPPPQASQSSAGARSAGPDNTEFARSSHLREPAHLFKGVIPQPTARHWHQPSSTYVLQAPPTTVVLPAQQQDSWHHHWRRYPTIFLQPFYFGFGEF